MEPMNEHPYQAAPQRYERGMTYQRCGNSGLLLPAVSLGLWHNFGDVDDFSNSKAILHHAFDHGITHFDLANNYGPPPGSAETNFGRVMKSSLHAYRDEIILSTKAGHPMWDGPYGDWGSRKHLMASLHQSLKRMNVDYVDIFYSHRYDPQTPLEETLGTLVDIVRQGKALYVGLSKYPYDAAEFAYRYLADHGVRCLLYQGRYNLLTRDVETSGVLKQSRREGAGFIAFSPLAQGLLTDRYLNGVPSDSRAARNGFLKASTITPELVRTISSLNDIARSRGESLAEMSLAWLLQHEEVTSVIVGASSVAQLDRNLKATACVPFSAAERMQIETLLSGR